MADAAGRGVYIVLILLGLLGISGLLGSVVETISQWSPMGALVDVMLSVIHEQSWNAMTSYSLLTVFPYLIVFVFIGIRWFRWDARYRAAQSF